MRAKMSRLPIKNELYMSAHLFLILRPSYRDPILAETVSESNLSKHFRRSVMIRKGKITEAIRSPIEKAEEKACDPVFHFI
jgi:hypothetical protein